MLDIDAEIRKAYREYYFRPSYIWQRIRRLRSIEDIKIQIQGLVMLVGGK